MNNKFRIMKIISLFTLILTINIAFGQIPEKFDLRNYNNQNYISSVKSQQGGTCWTFGTMASIESNMLMTGVWADKQEQGEPDLAEYHLDWWNGYNDHNNDDLNPPAGSGLEVHRGGDYRVSTAYLSRLEGAVRNSDAQSFDFPPERYSPDYVYYYVRTVEWYNIGENLDKIDTLKKRLMQNGAVATCMCYSGSFIDWDYNHYQPPSDNTLPNHSVTIIGWDDTHKTQAPQDGAWLVKNSWGTNWGNEGYFWISYYDKWAGTEPDMGAVSFKEVEPLRYKGVYYHDYHGWRDTKTETDSVFNAFTAEKDEWLQAVSFFTDADEVSYTVKVYDEFDGEYLSELKAVQKGFLPHRGFTTVDLDMPVKLNQGDDFFIALHLSQGGQPYDRTSEVPVLLGASARVLVESAAEPAQSYYYENGAWTDFYFYNDPSGFQNTGNFCVKGLSQDTPPEEFGLIFQIKDTHNQPIEGAVCELLSEQKTSNAQGEIIFNPVPENTNIEYSVFAENYGIKHGTVNISGESHTENVVYNSAFLSEKESIANIFPNPANNFVKIYKYFPQNAADYCITDPSGRIVKSGTMEQSILKLDISALETGIYFVRIKQNDTEQKFKLIKY